MKYAVRQQQDAQRNIRQSLRADLYLKKYPGRIDNNGLEERLKLFYKQQHWINKEDGYEDIVRVVQRVQTKSRLLRQQTSTTTAGVIHYKGLDNNMSHEDQQLLEHRHKNQDWPGICEVKYKPPLGRGIVVTKIFEKQEVLVDYHGVVENTSYKEYMARGENNGVKIKSEFVMCVYGPGKRLVDASSEKCTVEDHEHFRCQGRLVNHSSSKRANALSKDVLVRLEDREKRHVVLVAKKKINPFDQVLYDYGDPDARWLFREKRVEEREQPSETLQSQPGGSQPAPEPDLEANEDLEESEPLEETGRLEETECSEETELIYTDF